MEITALEKNECLPKKNKFNQQNMGEAYSL
jgi:hypothetical protein